MAESCHSRSLSWLVKPCIPSDPHRHFSTPSPLRLVSQPTNAASTPATTISDLPDDLLLECLSRLPASSLPSLPIVCRRFNRLLNSDSFAFLRRRLGLLNHVLIAVSVSLDLSFISSAILRLHPPTSNSGVSPNLDTWTIPLSVTSGSFSNARAVSTSRCVYLIGRDTMLRSDVWTRSVAICAKTVFPRKKFAVAAIGGRVYVAGGSSRTSAVEEYDPETDSWRIIGEAPCRR